MAQSESSGRAPASYGRRADLLEHTRATLGAGNVRAAVALPRGEDLSEWLAVNTVEFYKEISMLYGILSEYCTDSVRD